MLKDPVCGMEIPEQEIQHESRYKGKSYYFCSSKCANAFNDKPERYVQEEDKQPGSTRKIVIVGAGQVGSTFAFTLMESGLAREIVLIDVDKNIAEGNAMDLNHGRLFVPPARIYAGDYADCKNADIVVITAGASQKPGETRLHLVEKNTAIFQEIIPKIVSYDPTILLVVTNPVDILTYVTLKISGYPMSRVIGSGTVLDTARFRSVLSRHCRVDARNIHAYIIGEHGDSEVAVWSQANIAGISFERYCPICGRNCPPEEKQELFTQVKDAAYHIIQRKGTTNFAVALTVLRIVSSILRDERSVLTVSTYIEHYYGIDDVCLSSPVILDQNGISRVLKITLNDEEIHQLQDSAAVLKDTLKKLEV